MVVEASHTELTYRELDEKGQVLDSVAAAAEAPAVARLLN